MEMSPRNSFILWHIYFIKEQGMGYYEVLEGY